MNQLQSFLSAAHPIFVSVLCLAAGAWLWDLFLQETRRDESFAAAPRVWTMSASPEADAAGNVVAELITVGTTLSLFVRAGGCELACLYHATTVLRGALRHSG